jgi:hypothetical protein
MKTFLKNLKTFEHVLIFLFQHKLISQNCYIPDQFSGNTGNNMTIFYSQNALNQILNLDIEDWYIVASNSDGFSIGSIHESDVVNLTNNYGSLGLSLTIWGNDQLTYEIDGAINNEIFNVNLVNDNNLYSISSNHTYSTNSIISIDSLDINILDCSTISGCTFSWADNYNINANENDGSCYKVGCTIDLATNFSEYVTNEDNSLCMYSQSLVTNLQTNLDLYSDSIDHLNFVNDQNNLFIDTLQNNLYIALSNQEDGITQNDLNIVLNQLDSLNEQINSMSFSYIQNQINYFQEQITFTDSPTQYQTLIQAYSNLLDLYTQSNPNVFGEINVNLEESWNTIGYNILYETTINYQFSSIMNDIVIIKNNDGFIFWPQFNFNSIGNLIPGQGYQIRMENSRNFKFQQ